MKPRVSDSDARIEGRKICLAGRAYSRHTGWEFAMQILVLEDDVLIAMDLAATLEEMGASVQGPVHTAEQAELSIARRKPDLALLDFKLNGHTSERIAQRLEDMEVPVVFITGHSRRHLPERFRNHTIIQKPVSPKALRDLMHGMAAPV